MAVYMCRENDVLVIDDIVFLSILAIYSDRLRIDITGPKSQGFWVKNPEPSPFRKDEGYAVAVRVLEIQKKTVSLSIETPDGRTKVFRQRRSSEDGDQSLADPHVNSQFLTVWRNKVFVIGIPLRGEQHFQ